MALKIILPVVVLAALHSCNGQNNSTISSLANNENVSNGTKGDTVKELGKNIMVIFQDSKNNYWFGSWEDGLYWYDGKTILHFTTQSGLPNNRIEEIKEDHSGNIYISTGKGISTFDGQNFKTLSVADSSNFWQLAPNDLWFKLPWDSRYIFRYDGKILYRLQLPKHPNYTDSYAVYSTYKDRKGNLWFGTNPLGVFRYNGKVFDWISEADVTELHDGPANGVRSIIEDRDGNFWFCNTIWRYTIYGVQIPANLSHDKFYYYREKGIGNLNETESNDYQEYLSSTVDSNGHVWMATYTAGVYRYNGTKTIHYPVKAGKNDITVFSIYKDNHGTLWLGTHENGAYTFNGTSFEKFKP